MQKKFHNKYIYAGITGFCVLAALLICTFIFIHIDMVFEWFGSLNSALMPIYIGLAIAYLLSPLVNKVERNIFVPLFRKVVRKKRAVRGISRAVSVAVVLILALAVLCWLVMLVVPEVVDSIITLTNSLPGYYQNIVNKVNEMSGKHPEAAKQATEVSKAIYDQLIGWLQNELVPTSTELVSVISDGLMNIMGVLFNLVIGVIISIYLMAGNILRAGEAHGVFDPASAVCRSRLEHRERCELVVRQIFQRKDHRFYHCSDPDVYRTKYCQYSIYGADQCTDRCHKYHSVFRSVYRCDPQRVSRLFGQSGERSYFRHTGDRDLAGGRKYYWSKDHRGVDRTRKFLDPVCDSCIWVAVWYPWYDLCRSNLCCRV